MSQGPHNLLEDSRIPLVAGAGRQGHVDHGALALTLPHLVHPAGAGGVGELVGGDEEDVG